jgi:hypothetical protein
MVVVFLTTVTTRVVYEMCPIGHIAPPVKIDLGHERAVSVGFKNFWHDLSIAHNSIVAALFNDLPNMIRAVSKRN